MADEARRPLAQILPLIAGATIQAGCGGGPNATGSSPGYTSPSGTVSNGSSTGAQVAFSSDTYTVPASSTANLTIYRTGSAAGATTVGFTTVDGTATAGADYTATSGMLTWQDGDASPKSVKVAVAAQAAGRNFDISLTSISGSASFGAPSTAVIEVEAAGLSRGSVRLSWTAPITNTNGSALTNLAGFEIRYGTSTGAMTNKIPIDGAGVRSYVIDRLTSGTWYFEVFAVNSSGVKSGPSGVVRTTF